MSIKRKTKARKFLEELRGHPLSFGKMIESLRVSDGLTQPELGKRMGVSRQFINNVEKGKPVRPVLAAKFAIVMGYSIPMFITKAIEEELSREGIPLDVKLHSISTSDERELITSLIRSGEFEKAQQDIIVEALIKLKTSISEAKKLVRKYVNEKSSMHESAVA